MKKLQILILCLSTVFISRAQSVDMGIYGGANFAHVNITSPDMSAENRTGYQAGAFLRIGDLLYGQAGLEYQRTNYHFSRQVDLLTPEEDDISLSYMKLPLYVGLNLSPVEVVNARVYAGPAISYLFNVPVNQLEFTREDFNQIRLDGGIGAGVDILIFSVDVGYTFGVNELFTDEFDGKTNYGFVNVGLKF